jgi:hypothetical protein
LPAKAAKQPARAVPDRKSRKRKSAADFYFSQIKKVLAKFMQ